MTDFWQDVKAHLFPCVIVAVKLRDASNIQALQNANSAMFTRYGSVVSELRAVYDTVIEAAGDTKSVFDASVNFGNENEISVISGLKWLLDSVSSIRRMLVQKRGLEKRMTDILQKLDMLYLHVSQNSAAAGVGPAEE